MNSSAQKKPNTDDKKPTKMHSASARLTEADYRRLIEMVGPSKLNTNVCAFCTQAIQLTLDMLESDKKKPDLPGYIEIGHVTIKVNQRTYAKKGK
tara:strand:+ start:511 stop:795 length:285 start_codon:yes stop_codon:yes gene_type:complete